MYVNSKTASIVKASSFDRALLENASFIYFVCKHYENKIKTRCTPPPPKPEVEGFFIPHQPTAALKDEQKTISRESMAVVFDFMGMCQPEMKVIHDKVLIVQASLSEYQQRLVKMDSADGQSSAAGEQRAHVLARIKKFGELQTAFTSCCAGMHTVKEETTMQEDGKLVRTRQLIINHCQPYASKIVVPNADLVDVEMIEKTLDTCTRLMVVTNVIGTLIKHITEIPAYRHPDIPNASGLFHAMFSPFIRNGVQAWNCAADDLMFMCEKVCALMLRFYQGDPESKNIMSMVTARVSIELKLQTEHEKDEKRMVVLENCRKDALAAIAADKAKAAAEKAKAAIQSVKIAKPEIQMSPHAEKTSDVQKIE